MPEPTTASIQAAVEARRDEIVQMLLHLVAIPSVTGNEGDAQRFVAETLRSDGLEVHSFLSSEEEIAPYVTHVGEQPSFDDRPSVVGTLKGRGESKSLMIGGHVDTVPVEDRARWEYPPEGQLVGDRIYGLGATDMKGGVVAAMMVPRILHDLGVHLAGDLFINSVTGEEDGGLGTMSTILQGYHPDGVVITEPTYQRVGVASGGSLVFRITVTGKAAHGGNRNQGVNAIEKFIPIFQDLLAWEAERQATVHHPLYDHYENKFPINVGSIRAGEWASTVPDKLTAEGRLGFLPGESMESMMEQTHQRVAAVAEKDDWLSEHPPVVEFFSGQFVAEEIPVDHPLTQAVLAAHKDISGEETEAWALTAGTDARLWIHFTESPAVLYGAGLLHLAHQSNEYNEVEPLLESIAVLTRLAIDWCGIADS
ncbi:MAG: ArgE/DapE family deacylase [Thermomicrobiales bacterium]|nr:ArgE/DapE family deacylase [Thermomicrobiales bacterium]